jgi:hypothetical protein
MRHGLLVLAALTAAGCAQARQPTGGEPITTPPRVVEVSPAPFSVQTALSQPVVIRFDRRLSERLQGVRELRDAVLVSPETGEVRVRRRRRHLEISVDGGWQPGLVYRVVVLPVIQDLFNNVRSEPIELVFSTGPDIPETAVAGLVEDRLTGRAVADTRVEATSLEAAHAYVAMTDSAGFFALRHLPAGEYQLHAWLDRNRDRSRDFAEPRDSTPVALAAQDTMVLELALLPGDTTQARLTTASMIDSTKIQLTFDDYFEPGPVGGTGRLYLAEDTSFVAEGTLFHGTRTDSLRAADREAEGAAADTAGAAPAGPPAPAPSAAGPPAGRASGAEPRRDLPQRELVLLLADPLEPDTRYLVVVADVTNIHGIPGGGGSASFTTPARPAVAPDPPPDAGPPAAAPPDTTSGGGLQGS